MQTPTFERIWSRCCQADVFRGRCQTRIYSQSDSGLCIGQCAKAEPKADRNGAKKKLQPDRAFTEYPNVGTFSIDMGSEKTEGFAEPATVSVLTFRTPETVPASIEGETVSTEMMTQHICGYIFFLPCAYSVLRHDPQTYVLVDIYLPKTSAQLL